MGNDFGLGLVLSFTDNASAGINSAVSSLSRLTDVAENASNSLSNIASLSALSVTSNQLGNMFSKAGNGILNAFSSIINKVQETGQEFTIFRNTARALYSNDGLGLDEVESKVENAVSQLMDFSAKTIFETKDLTGQFVTITANGYDAFADMTATASGQTTKLMSAIADLMTFRSDVPAAQWSNAIRNAFGGQVRSLKNALDLNPEDILGHSWTEGDIAQNFVDLADALGVLGLSGGNFASNIQAQVSNIADVFSKFYLQIADTGVFDLLTQKMILLTTAISAAIEDNEPLVTSVSEALKSILTPLVEITEVVTALIPRFTEWLGNNPFLVKMIVNIGALAGVFLLMGGIILKATSALSGLSLFVLTFGKDFNKLSSFIRIGSLKIMGILAPLTLLVSMFAIAWRNNFGNIRTAAEKFGQSVSNAFGYAREAMNGNIDDMRTILSNLMDEDPSVSKLAIGLMKVSTLFKALCETWGGYTLSEDTFEKANELGLIPLIENILDLKFRFENFIKGFTEGVKEVAEGVVGFVKGLKLPDNITEGFTNLTETLSSNDPKRWEELGKIVGSLGSKIVLAIVGFKLVFGVLKAVKTVVSPVITAFTVLASTFSKLKTGFEIVMLFLSKGKAGIMVLAKLSGAFGLIQNALSKVYKIATFIGKNLMKGGILMTIGSIIGGVLNFISMLKNGVTKIKAVIQVVLGALAGLGLVLAGIAAWPAVLIGALVGAVSVGIAWLITNWKKVEAWFASIKNWIVNTIITPIVTKASSIWNDIESKISSFINGVKSIFSNLVNWIRNNVIVKIQSFFSNLWGGIKTAFSKVAKTVSSVIKGAINSVLNFVGGMINGVISGINSAITLINKIPGVNITSIEPLNIPQLAQGGIVTAPTNAIIGENGTEAVMPLEKNTQWIGVLAKMIKTELQEITPTNRYRVSSTSTPTSGYMASNSTLNSYTGDTDNSITFSSGAIQITANNSSDIEAERLAKKIMEYIKRQQQLNKMINYA